MNDFRLLVGNLNYWMTDNDLKILFSPYGVVTTHIVFDGVHGWSKGFAFVNVDSKTHLLDAVKQLDGIEINKRKLAVKEAIPTPNQNQNIHQALTNNARNLFLVSTDFSLLSLWNRFLNNETLKSYVEDEANKRFNDQKDTVNLGASQRKQKAQTQFEQIKIEYEKAMSLLKPYL
jgi:RNA recognition motif-containing protein